MNKPWYERNPALLTQVREDLGAYPNLRLTLGPSVASIVGRFPVLDEAGRTVLDEYEVEIELPPDFPAEVPIVREVGGRVPEGSTHHMNPGRKACLLVEEEWLLRKDHASLRAFLSGPLRDYFLWQHLVAAGKPAPWNGRPHREDGQWEVYGEWCGTVDRAAIRLYLQYVAMKKVRGHLRCPCGSGKHLRDCHMSLVRQLRTKLPAKLARRALSKLPSPA